MRVASAVFALITFTAVAGAQQTNRAFVKVTAHDSSGAPIAGAEITVRSGLKDVVAQTTTDSVGHGLISVPAKDSTDYQLTMRKIGYVRGDRFFSVGPRDTTVVNVIVPRPLANTLDAVKVTASRVNKFDTYDLTSDEIENADGWLGNGWEVIKKLRPVMLTSRGGCSTGAQEVWVNGKRIRLPLYPTGLAAARARVGVPPRARFSYVPVSVLSEIAPEHIAEIHYHDCFDHSMAAVGSNDAIFVVLKPGVIYQEGTGSFVISEEEEEKMAAAKKK
ncbi:MAG TPA: carboxypeptidase-like regulatory domain-containing protein [Gemmatimonadaceae bacterium]